MRRPSIRWPFVLIYLIGLGLVMGKCFGATVSQTATPAIPITKDPAIQRDFQQAMNAIQYPNVSTGTAQNFTIVNSSITNLTVSTAVSSMTITNLTVVNSTFTNIVVNGAVVGIPGRIIQYVQASETTTQTTTSNSYVTTTLTASITPGYSTSVILIIFSGEFQTPVGGSCFVTVQRGSTELAANNNGMCDAGSGTVGLVTNCGPAIIDSPATTSSTQYIVKFKSNSSGTCTWGANSGSSHIILAELKQ